MSDEIENNNTNGVRTREKGASAKKARPKSTISTNSVAINIGRPVEVDLSNQTEVVSHSSIRDSASGRAILCTGTPPELVYRYSLDPVYRYMYSTRIGVSVLH
ncbi:hypothetical protein RRG08_008092 [Elysia crispata]|uniref:Uncharacterized protein n=1 Tax=Elysia crispata TaxID=231223 RepID=A0AAE1CVN3_9GAST|nr:hypothetical protein RRG08_008092 [Elysia crispata]